MTQSFTPQTLQHPDQLFRLLQSISTELQTAKQQIAALQKQLATPRLTPADLAAIRTSLMAGGSNALNVANLLGILAQSQRGFGIVSSTLAGLPAPTLYEVGTFGIVTGPPAKIYFVTEGTPRAWTDTSISSAAPSNMVTTDTNQTLTAAATKTMLALLTLSAGLTVNGGVVTASGLITANGGINTASLTDSGLLNLALGTVAGGGTYGGGATYIGMIGTSMNMPTTPSIGDTYVVLDALGAASVGSPLTINGNGHNINGAGSITITVKYGGHLLVYTGSQWQSPF
jgi:hypothetical protein